MGMTPSELEDSSAAATPRSEARDEAITRMIMLEAVSYETPEARAAYRAGMSTAAAICDAVAAKHTAKRMNKTQIMLKNIATTCGDEIMRFRELMKVDEPRGLSASEDGT